MKNNFSYPITFLPCKDLDEIRNFYTNILNLEIALEQGQCVIFKIGSGKLSGYWGFCSHYNEFITPARRVCLTLVVETQEEVDEWYQTLTTQQVECTRDPQYTTQFKIYNAFFKDPMGYTIEIQAFDKDAQPKGV